MLSRIVLLVITLFWVTMNYLLWRSEYGRDHREGASVPAAVVWKKILTAPDGSALEILHHGKKIGDCHLSSRTSEELSSASLDDKGFPVRDPNGRSANYRIDVDGNAAVEGSRSHVHFDFNLKLMTNQAWQEFNLRVAMRPSFWELHALAADQSIRLHSEDDEGKWDRVLKYSDLSNPDSILRELDLPPQLKLLGLAGVMNPGGRANTRLSLGLEWEAHDDWITMGHASVRAYRLNARLLDRYGIVIVVSRVGEILRMELPDEWILVSNPLNSF